MAGETRSGRNYQLVRSEVDGDLCSAYFEDGEAEVAFSAAPRAVTDGAHHVGGCYCRWCSICGSRIHPDEVEHADADCPEDECTAEGYALFMKHRAPDSAGFTKRYVGVHCWSCDMDAFCAAARAADARRRS